MSNLNEVKKEDTYKFWCYMAKKYPKQYKIVRSGVMWHVKELRKEYARSGSYLIFKAINPVTCE